MFGRTRFRLALLATGAILTGGAIVANAGTSAYTFDGSPPAPAPVTDPHLDVQVHSRDYTTWYSLEGMTAMHGTDCAGPPATHRLTGSYGDSVFQCKDHIMTAINASGYGEIVLTPDAMVDFGSGGTVSFDVSTDKMSVRDWWDVTITPWAENLTLPLISDLSQGVDLQDPPKNAINISIDTAEGSPLLKVFRSGVETDYNAGWNTDAIPSGIPSTVNQDAVRQPFRVTLSRTHVRFERLASATAPGDVYFDFDVADVGFSQGVVQFGHHSYNPTKDGAGVPATWHWDNLALSPALPFSMTKLGPSNYSNGSGRYLDTNGQTLTVPVAGTLRFAAICKVTIDGKVLTPQMPTVHPDHFNSYFVQMTAGIHTFTFSNDSGWPGCMAEGFAVWNASGSLPTATPTNASTPTSTPASQTATPTQTSTPPPTVTVPPAAGWTTSARTSATTIRRGSTIAINATVRSGSNAKGLVDIEVYGPSGQKVMQRFWDNQTFTAGVGNSYSTSWKAPTTAARGTYTVKIGVFSTGWGTMYSWNNGAVTFQVD